MLAGTARTAPLPLLLLISCLAVACAQKTNEAHYHADLSGNAVIPPVNSPGSGRTTFDIYQITQTVRDDHKTVTVWLADYQVIVNNVTNVYSVEVHQAPVGSNGDLVAFLFGPQDNPSPGPPANGVIASGTLDRGALHGPLRNRDISDFKARADDSDMYVLIVTTAHPDGELRGQVYPGG